MIQHPQTAVDHLSALRAAVPLVHNITNLVVMHTTANALLCAGASPVMAHAPEEVEEITALASALVLNIGTLDRGWIASMRLAQKAANLRGIPVVIDPVGAGASRLRTQTALELLEGGKNCLLRGNASEILALAGAGGGARGVDSTAETAGAAGAARELARRYGCVVCASGAVDIVTDGETLFSVTGGSPHMAKVTGMGCTASALTAAFAAVCPSGERAAAAVSAMAAMAAAGMEAENRCAGPGSFLVAFLDALHRLSPAALERVRVEERPWPPTPAVSGSGKAGFGL